MNALRVGGCLLLLSLAGCGSVVDYTLAKTDEQDCQWLRILGDEPICHPYSAPERKALPESPPLFCYETLGDVVCRMEPIANRAHLNSG